MSSNEQSISTTNERNDVEAEVQIDDEANAGDRPVFEVRCGEVEQNEIKWWMCGYMNGWDGGIVSEQFRTVIISCEHGI